MVPVKSPGNQGSDVLVVSLEIPRMRLLTFPGFFNSVKEFDAG